MFLLSPKFGWSFSYLPKCNWSICTLPKCSYFTQIFLILPKMLLQFFSWPKFDEGCLNYHMIPVHFILPSGAKKEWLFCRFGYYFALVWKIDTTSLSCEYWMQLYTLLNAHFENLHPKRPIFPHWIPMPYAYDNNGHNMQLIVEVIITSHTGSSGLMSE